MTNAGEAYTQGAALVDAIGARDHGGSLKRLVGALEGISDGVGFASVLDALATLASEKAEHLASNWQDRAAAKAWERVARLTATASDAADRHGF